MNVEYGWRRGQGGPVSAAIDGDFQCSVCGRAPSRMIQEMKDVTEPGAEFKTFAPDGPPVFGCAVHFAEILR